MESSKIFGAEECQSSESGWTMYIGSPTRDDDDDDGHDNDHDHDHKKTVVYHDDEYMYDGSDDSMASDASSGPSHLHQHTWEGNGENGRAMDVHEHHKEDRVKKQVKKKKKKTRFEASKETKEQCLVTQKRGIVTVQSGNKPRHIGQRNSK